MTLVWTVLRVLGLTLAWWFVFLVPTVGGVLWASDEEKTRAYLWALAFAFAFGLGFGL